MTTGPQQPGTLLGEGGMGQVFAALSPTGEPIAVKRMRSVTDGDRLRREGRALQDLQGHGVPRFLELSEGPDGPQLAMERLNGETLEATLRRIRLPSSRLRDLHASVARTLARAHAAGWTHRDVKPANLFLEEDGRTLLLDWGIATHRDEPASETGVPGTRGFLAPEVLDGAPGGPSQDLYALGATLLRTSTGLRPPERGTAEQLATLLQASVLPADWRALVQRCLHPDPARRFPDAATLADALSALSDGQAESPPTSTMLDVSPPVPPAVRRSRRPWIGGGFALAMAGAVAAFWALRSPPSGLIPSCQRFAATLASQQHATGGFGGTPHHAGDTGWDTAQQLAALELASARCGADVRRTLDGGHTRLLQLETAPITVASAWAALAGEPRGHEELKASQNDDGGYGWTAGGASHPYATVLALLALPPGPHASRAADWVLGHEVVRTTPGLDEQAFIALRAHERLPQGYRDALLARIAARCGDATCSAATDGRLEFAPGSVVVLQWLPWAALASADAPELHARIRGRLLASEATLPGYILAERLYALAALSPR